jgi:hypothetical protein
MKIPEILLAESVHQGRKLAEITVEIDELANPDFCSRLDARPNVRQDAAVLALAALFHATRRPGRNLGPSEIGPVARNFCPVY